MKRKILVAFSIVLIIGLAAVVGLFVWSARVPPYHDNQDLKAKLETVYVQYLQSIQNENPSSLLATLTSTRVADLTRFYELRHMKFPDDFFTTIKKSSLRLPPTDKFRYIAVTQGDKYANLIYVGNMNSYLHKTQDEQRFLVIQFEKEKEDWKYAVIVDPPANIVPHLEDRLRDGSFYFLKFKPFAPKKIELIP